MSSLSGAIKKFVAYVGIEIKGKECEKTNWITFLLCLPTRVTRLLSQVRSLLSVPFLYLLPWLEMSSKARRSECSGNLVFSCAFSSVFSSFIFIFFPLVRCHFRSVLANTFPGLTSPSSGCLIGMSPEADVHPYQAVRCISTRKVVLVYEFAWIHYRLGDGF